MASIYQSLPSDKQARNFVPTMTSFTQDAKRMTYIRGNINDHKGEESEEDMANGVTCKNFVLTNNNKDIAFEQFPVNC